MKPEIMAQIILSVLACLIVGNAVGNWIFDTKNYLAGEMYSPLTVLSAAWLLMLVFVPKRIKL